MSWVFFSAHRVIFSVVILSGVIFTDCRLGEWMLQQTISKEAYKY